MYVDFVKLINFRNYKSLSINLDKKVNIFTGENAVGKTNLIESIYMASKLKSFRTVNEKDIINENAEALYFKVDYVKYGIVNEIELKIERSGKKTVRYNNDIIKKKSDIEDSLDVVLFSPDDMYMIKDSPAKRRKFMDDALSSTDINYRSCLSSYNKALFMRNKVLREYRYISGAESLLGVYDIELAKYGTHIIHARDDFIANVFEKARRIHNILCSNEDFDILYVSNVKRGEDRKETYINFINELSKSRKKDIEKKTSSAGPHRDDMKISINGKNIRVYGSQGQIRTSVLNLKLCLCDIIKEKKNDTPVLILDDVFSELDSKRRKFLLKSIDGMQTVFTMTDAEDFKAYFNKDYKLFRIKN